VDVHNAFNLMSRSTILQELQFSFGSLDQLSHLFDDFMHVHPHYIYFKLLEMRIS
jgi:hypothetical protein